MHSVVKSDIKPDEIIDILKSDALRSNIASPITHWGHGDIREPTLAAFIFYEAMRSLYFNEERNAKASRPFVLEHSSKLEQACDEDRCDSTTGEVRADLALIDTNGKPLLWIEVKNIHNTKPLTKSILWKFRCDIKHSAQFDRGICIIIYEDLLNFSDYQSELEELAAEQNVELLCIVV